MPLCSCSGTLTRIRKRESDEVNRDRERLPRRPCRTSPPSLPTSTCGSPKLRIIKFRIPGSFQCNFEISEVKSDHGSGTFLQKKENKQDMLDLIVISLNTNR